MLGPSSLLALALQVAPVSSVGVEPEPEAHGPAQVGAVERDASTPQAEVLERDAGTPPETTPEDVEPEATPEDAEPEATPEVEPAEAEPEDVEPEEIEPQDTSTEDEAADAASTDPPAEPSGGGGVAGGGAAGGGAAGGGAAGGGAAGAASGGPGGSGGALASGSVRSDDDELRDREPEDEGRRSRRRRRREAREEGQWQVFAPFPELGPIRYRDPEQVRVVWLGADVAGSWLPSSLGLSDRAVWTVRPAGAWAVALAPWLALGGRHSVAWYDAQDVRTRVHAHQVELSGRPLAGSRPDIALDDRLSLGVSTHAIRWSEADDLSIEPGGLDDTIVHLGYGLDHLLGTRWRLGWQAQVRYAWVHRDTQRHARLSARLAFNPRPAHRLWADAVGYYVNRDAQPRGQPRPRHSLYGQFGLGYAWVANAGVGPFVRLRYTTGFMSGEAPVYELRAEALSADYGEVQVGLMVRLP